MFFNRKPQQQTVVITTPTPADDDTRQLFWATSQLDRDVYLRELAALTEMVINVQPGESGYSEYKQKITKKFEKLNAQAAKIDFDYLTQTEQKTLVNLLTGSLTSIKDEIVLNAHESDWYDLYYHVEDDVPEITHELLELVNDQDNRKRAQAVLLSSDAWQNIPVDATDDTVGASDKIAFPVFTSTNEAVQAAYEKLRASWSQASLSELSVEDAYTVRALATDYLPDSIRIYQRLLHRSSMAAEQGTQLFLGQLTLLQQQLDDVLAHETQDALSEMQAQTRFLQRKAPVTDTI